MKVYICSPFESKMAKRGTRHPRLAEFLCADGHDVEYVTTNFSHARKEYFDPQEIAHYTRTLPYKLIVLKIFGYYQHVSIRRILVHIYLSLRYFIYLINKVKRRDTIVVPSRPPELVFCVMLLKLIKGPKTLVDIRDIWPDMLTTENKVKDAVFRIYCNLYWYLTLRSIDKFAHTAPSFLNWLKRYAPRRRSQFIPLGFDADRWLAMKPLSKSSINRKLELVYVGELSHQIDLTGMIKAISRNSKYFLTIIGGGADTGKIKHLVRESSAKNIGFTGYIPFQDVVEQLRTKHIGVIPMVSDAMPNKLFDYVASCLPILALGDNDASAFVERHNIGWKKDFDVKGLRDFVTSLCVDEVVEKSKNVAKIRDRFSKEELYRKYIELIAA